MIAIPIDVQGKNIKSSKLFGNVKSFAIFSKKRGEFIVVENTETGNGIKTAEFLQKLGVTDTIYSYMGKGVFTSLYKNGINVHYIGNEPMYIVDIIDKLKQNEFILLDSTNSAKYLDSGLHTSECECA